MRRLTTLGARLAVSVLFGARVSDVNCPFRLMRREALQRLLPGVPPTTFAPNVALTGLAVRRGFRLFQAAVTHRSGGPGSGAIAGWKALGVAVRSGLELVAIAVRSRVGSSHPSRSGRLPQ